MSNPDAASRFDEIYNSTHRPVLAFITARCKHTADAGDIFQETYLELYRVLLRRGADYVTNDKALVLRIAQRKIARNYSFWERLRGFVPLNAGGDDAGENALPDAVADAFLTEDFAIGQVLLESAWRFIREKPEDVQKVFYLFYGLGLTIPEIARELSLSESGVKNKLYRTIKELRELMK